MADSAFNRRVINNVYYPKISEVATKCIKENIRFKFVTEDELPKDRTVPKVKLEKTDLNQNYTFETFVVGNSNRMAVITALKVAENPGVLFNPLYIFGNVGLGKTHLMQAIGNYISEKNYNYKILYVQANDYLLDFTRALRDDNMPNFEEKYKNIDILLIDDIQMLIGKDLTQQQFFNLFNELDNSRKQIVITSDRPAKELNIMKRLTSRFEKGGIVDIKAPDLEQRICIIKKKAQELFDLSLSEDVINYIANNLTTNVRELEGAINRLIIYSNFCANDSISLEMVKEAIDVCIVNKTKKKEYEYSALLELIAEMYNVGVKDIIGNSRKAEYVLPRHIVMYILKEKYDLPFKKIGHILNGRDHSTIISGYEKIQYEIKNDKEMKMAIDLIYKKLGE